MLSMPDGRLLIGTANQGLKLLDPEKDTYEDLLTWSDGDVGVYVRFMAHYGGDEYWIATESGIYIINIATKKYINLRKQYNNPYSLSDNAIYCIHRDREGGMWAGSYFGASTSIPNNTATSKNTGRTIHSKRSAATPCARFARICTGTSGPARKITA